MEAREGTEDRAATAQKRPRGGGEEPRQGLPGEKTNSSRSRRAPEPEPSQKRAATPREHQEVAEPPKGEAPGLCLGRHTASTLGRAWQLCQGTSPFPQGDSSHPATSHMTCLVGRVLEPHAMGHWEELGPGRRPQAQGRQRRRGPGSSPSTGEPHTLTRFPITRGQLLLDTSIGLEQAGPPVPQKGAYK